MTSEQLRWLWTSVGAVGVAVFLWLIREARLDDWAISQVRPARLDVFRMHIRGELWDLGVLLLVIGSMFGAGVLAMFGYTVLAIVLLVVAEVSVVLLGLIKLRRRRAMFRTVRLNRKAR